MRRLAASLCALQLLVAQAGAVNVVIDYTFAPSFFSTSTTNGQQARATVEAAADYFSEILDDSFVSVQKPDDYISTAQGGPPAVTSWNWETRFTNPTTGAEASFSNPTIPADEYRIYVGARSLPGSTLGVGGPGGFQSSVSISYYFQSQLDEINAISADFDALLNNRQEAEGEFGRWGGALTFDTGTTWNYDHTSLPSNGENDLFSVALHELGHAIGLGASSEWNALTNTGTYTGQAGISAYGGAPPLSSGHWAPGTQSTVFGGTASQETAMDPNLTVGTRKLWTTLDAAGLTDIGWDVVAPVLSQPGDYNADGMVDAADYTVWRDSLGTPQEIGTYAEWSSNYGAGSAPAASNSIPEPTAFVGLISLLAASTFAGRRQQN